MDFEDTRAALMSLRSNDGLDWEQVALQANQGGLRTIRGKPFTGATARHACIPSKSTRAHKKRKEKYDRTVKAKEIAIEQIHEVIACNLTVELKLEFIVKILGDNGVIELG